MRFGGIGHFPLSIGHWPLSIVHNNTPIFNVVLTVVFGLMQYAPTHMVFRGMAFGGMCFGGIVHCPLSIVHYTSHIFTFHANVLELCEMADFLNVFNRNPPIDPAGLYGLRDPLDRKTIELQFKKSLMNKSKKISVLPHLDTSHCRKSDGKSKFFLKVRISGQARLYDIQPELAMDKSYWVHEIDPDSGKRKKRMRIQHARNNPNSKTLERQLGAKVQEMIDLIEDMLRKGHAPSHLSLGERWKGSDAKSLVEYIDWRISEERQGVSHGTYMHWKTIRNCIAGYDPNVLLSEITAEWMRRYEHYLRNEKEIFMGSVKPGQKPKPQGVGLSSNSVLTRFHFLGKILNHAAKSDFIAKNPMGLFYDDKATRKRFAYRRPERNVLSGEDIERLHKAYLDRELITLYEGENKQKQTRGEKYHDVLQQILASIYTGFRFGDISKFQDGMEVAIHQGRITLTMQKVKRRQTLKATDRLMEVLSLEENGRLFARPIYSNFHANKLLREVLAALGFVKYYSWHDLRRTFASYLQEKNVDIHKVSKLMGHTSVVTTERYVKVRDQDLDSAMGVWDDQDEKLSPEPPEPDAMVAEILELVRRNPGIELPEGMRNAVAAYLPVAGLENHTSKTALRVVG
jgi:integrase